MVLNEIDNAFIGNTQVDYIYLGDTLIYPSEVPPIPPVPPVIPNNEIWYTTTNNQVFNIFLRDEFIEECMGANIISNTYENGKGVLVFDGDVTKCLQHSVSGLFSSIHTEKTDRDTIKSVTFPQTVEEIKLRYAWYLEDIVCPTGIPLDVRFDDNLQRVNGELIYPEMNSIEDVFYISAKEGDTLYMKFDYGDGEYADVLEISLKTSEYIAITASYDLETGDFYTDVERTFTFNRDYEGWVRIHKNCAFNLKEISGVKIIGVSYKPKYINTNNYIDYNKYVWFLYKEGRYLNDFSMNPAYEGAVFKVPQRDYIGFKEVYSPHDEIWYYRLSRIPTTFGDIDKSSTAYVIEHTYSYDESLGYGKGVVKFGYNRDYPVIPYNIFKHDDDIIAIYYPEDVEVTGGDWIDSLPKLRRINCDTDGVAIFGGATRYLNGIIPPIDYNVSNFKTIILGKNVKSLSRYSLDLNYGGYFDECDIYCYSTIQPTILRSPILIADMKGTLHYPKGSDYSGLIAELGSRWTAVADL